MTKIQKGMLLLLLGWLIGIGINSCRKKAQAEKETIKPTAPEWLKTEPIPE